MIHGQVSFKYILNKLYRDLDINTEIPEGNVVEWVSEALAKIGAYSQYEPKNAIIELTDGKALLPQGFHRLESIRYQGNPVYWSNNAFVYDYGCDECVFEGCCAENTFYINSSYIVTNIKDESPNNEICISYLSIPVDAEGYPLIPDDVYFMEACAKYVTYMLDYREWRKGNLPDKVINKSEQDYLFYVNSARGSANMPNVAKMEALKNIMIRLIPSQDQYSNGFQGFDKPERRRRF